MPLREPPIVALLHAAATLAMMGVIWFVQWVHYPLFPFASGPRFGRFSRQHRARTGAVVGPLMLVEAATAAWLAAARADAWTWGGLLLLALIWVTTATVQVPQHRALARGYDEAVAARLVRFNWLRTVAWTARGGVALAIVAT